MYIKRTRSRVNNIIIKNLPLHPPMMTRRKITISIINMMFNVPAEIIQTSILITNIVRSQAGIS
jgi:hypothetical protein